MRKQISVLILAAGYSKRLGRPKISLKMPDGSYFLDNIIEQYLEFACKQIIVVVNQESSTHQIHIPIEYIVASLPNHRPQMTHTF